MPFRDAFGWPCVTFPGRSCRQCPRQQRLKPRENRASQLGENAGVAEAPPDVLPPRRHPCPTLSPPMRPRVDTRVAYTCSLQMLAPCARDQVEGRSQNPMFPPQTLAPSDCTLGRYMSSYVDAVGIRCEREERGRWQSRRGIHRIVRPTALRAADYDEAFAPTHRAGQGREQPAGTVEVPVTAKRFSGRRAPDRVDETKNRLHASQGTFRRTPKRG